MHEDSEVIFLTCGPDIKDTDRPAKKVSELRNWKNLKATGNSWKILGIRHGFCGHIVTYP